MVAGFGYDLGDPRGGWQGGGDGFQVAAVGAGAQGGPEVEAAIVEVR